MRFLVLLIFTCFQPWVWGQESCLIIRENGKNIIQEGRCDTREAPCSTFKIAIALMAFNEGILKNESLPVLPFKTGYATYLDSWRESHDPQKWMRNSCVWYSQVVTQEMGMTLFKKYVEKFDYGNKDITGDPGQNNGLTQCWLSSSLKISPQEQVEFLEKFLSGKLPISRHAGEKTKKILYIKDLPNGWKLFGKTGNGYLLNADGSKNYGRQVGWFIGWIQKEERVILFVKRIIDSKKEETYASQRAKSLVTDYFTKNLGRL